MDNDETITITTDVEYTFDINDLTVNTIDISSLTSSATVDTITLDDHTQWADGIRWDSVEFEDTMPTVAKVEDMCNEYPALQKAYENFKTIYAMVHQDWKGKQEDDEQFPF